MSFKVLFDFEEALAKYTGAPYAVVTDCCTHAIELCMRLDNINATKFTAYTYVSIPQLLKNLNIKFSMISEQWVGEYQFYNTNIWDSARRLERGMYRRGMKQCLSFGNGKPLQIGRCGAILLDDVAEYRTLSRMRSDGRDLSQSPWEDYPIAQGFHYCPTLESCALGLELLPNVDHVPTHYHYPDCRMINFV